MRRYSLMVVMLLAVFVLQGCNTLKGAAEGFKKDWEAADEYDTWFKENLW